MRRSKDIAWLGGLLEGEGSFSVDKNSYASIQLMMVDFDTIQRASAIVGTLARGPYATKTPGGDIGKPVYSCRIYGNRAIQWMMTLYQFLGERRQATIRSILDAWKVIPVKLQKDWKAPRGKQTPAKCHPARQVHGGGLCFNCYQKQYRAHGCLGMRRGTWTQEEMLCRSRNVVQN